MSLPIALTPRTPARPDRRPAWPAATAATAATLLGLVLGLGPAPAAAHTATEPTGPASPGWRLGAALGLAGVDADGPVPGPRLDGQTTVGDVPGDSRRQPLEHATLDLAARPDPRLGLQLALGRHGSDAAHVEAAWLALRPQADSAWSLGLGRRRVPLGGVLTEAGHYDRFLQAPLVKRAAFHGDWIEDGANLAWRAPADTSGPLGLDGADLGLWRAATFPGGDGARPAPVLHLQGGWPQGRWDLLAAWLQPQARGSHARPAPGAPGVGHSHGLPDCGGSLREVVCFDGDVALLGGSLAWQPAAAPGWRLVLAGLLREESGALYGRNGDARYTGRAWGGWLELNAPLAPGWVAALRSEGLNARNRLAGPGATLLARDAGLDRDTPSWRHTLALGWQAAPAWWLGLEAGRESLAGQAQTVVALRLRWQAPALLRGD